MALPLPEFSNLPPELTSRDGRTLLYRAISQELREKTKNGRRVPLAGRTIGLRVLRSITELIFLALLRDGVFYFPDGFGSFHIKRVKQPRMKRLPTGKYHQMPANRVRVIFKEGTVVRDLVGLPPEMTTKKRKYPRRTSLAKKTLTIVKEPTV